MKNLLQIVCNLKIKPFNSLHFVDLHRHSETPSQSVFWSKYSCTRNTGRRSAGITYISGVPKLSFFGLGILTSLGMNSWLPDHCCMLLLRAGVGPLPGLEQHPFYSPDALASPAFHRLKFSRYCLSVSWDRQHTVELLRSKQVYRA